jgi:hypothetical protein
MELSNTVVCECTGKSYKCLRAHLGTKIHKDWENMNMVKEFRILNKQLENKIIQLERTNSILLETIQHIRDPFSTLLQEPSSS